MFLPFLANIHFLAWSHDLIHISLPDVVFSIAGDVIGVFVDAEGWYTLIQAQQAKLNPHNGHFVNSLNHSADFSWHIMELAGKSWCCLFYFRPRYQIYLISVIFILKLFLYIWISLTPLTYRCNNYQSVSPWYMIWYFWVVHLAQLIIIVVFLCTLFCSSYVHVAEMQGIV